MCVLSEKIYYLCFVFSISVDLVLSMCVFSLSINLIRVFSLSTDIISLCFPVVLLFVCCR